MFVGKLRAAMYRLHITRSGCLKNYPAFAAWYGQQNLPIIVIGSKVSSLTCKRGLTKGVQVNGKRPLEARAGVAGRLLIRVY